MTLLALTAALLIAAPCRLQAPLPDSVAAVAAATRKLEQFTHDTIPLRVRRFQRDSVGVIIELRPAGARTRGGGIVRVTTHGLAVLMRRFR